MPDIPCFRCGTCCIAPDIAALAKPVGVACAYLTAACLCRIYPDRPDVCRRYRPDEICLALQQLPPAERVGFFLRVYALENAAAEQVSGMPAGFHVGDDGVQR